MSEFENGMIHRLNSRALNSNNVEYKSGFEACLKRLSLINTALNNILYELLAARELWENSASMNHTGKGEEDSIAKNISKHIQIGLKKIAVSSALLNATKIYELTIHKKESKYYAPLLEALDKKSYDRIKKMFSAINYDVLNKLRNKSIAHISKVEFTELNQLMEELIPTGNLSDFFNVLLPEMDGKSNSIHEVATTFNKAINDVPGYTEYRNALHS